jgi:hypothetical protein
MLHLHAIGRRQAKARTKIRYQISDIDRWYYGCCTAEAMFTSAISNIRWMTSAPAIGFLARASEAGDQPFSNGLNDLAKLICPTG